MIRYFFIVPLVFFITGCGFSPLHNFSNSMDLFKNIDIKREDTFIAFLIEESLEERAPFGENPKFRLDIKPAIRNSYGVITKENEITRYSVTLRVDYSLYNNEDRKLLAKGRVSATSDYSAAVTYTGFATEIARKDTYDRLADIVAEKMIIEILINFSGELSN
jgi:LPS-assembly lipoprotein